MKLLEKTAHWWRELFRRRRLSLRNAIDEQEEWYMHISPAGVASAFVALLLVLFILILVLAAYTPVLEFLPGYRTEAARSRENMIANIMRLDSMERMMNDMMTYNENIAQILEGRTPVSRTISNADSTRTGKVLVVPSAEDSLLRAQMEGDGPYALAGRSGSRRQVREAIELVTPAEGIITERFDIGENRFGVRIAAAPGDRITAIDNGTVLQSLWTPENGYIILLQHAGNLVSVYKNLSRSLVATGQAVRGGEQIGYSTEADVANEEQKLFEFELWNNGKPVDPEGYIVF